VSQPGNTTPADRKLEKRLRHECLRCTDQALPDSDFCLKHRDDNRKRAREGAAKARAELRRAHKCIGCKRKSKTLRCRRCEKKNRGTVTSVKSADLGVSKDEVWRADPGKRPGLFVQRYRGKARRGRLSREDQAEEDKRDARFAIAEIEKFIVEADRLVTPEVLELPRIQREAERRKATLFLGSAGRFIDELSEKYG
jgi:hypothetical protein